MKKITMGAALAALALGGAAFAADSTKDTGRGVLPGIDVDVNADLKHPILDKNSDGKISKSEASQNKDVSKQFTRLDINHDGYLDDAEYAKLEVKSETKSETKSDVTSNRGDEAPNKNDVPGTTNDSTPGNKDLPGPRR